MNQRKDYPWEERARLEREHGEYCRSRTAERPDAMEGEPEVAHIHHEGPLERKRFPYRDEELYLYRCKTLDMQRAFKISELSFPVRSMLAYFISETRPQREDFFYWSIKGMSAALGLTRKTTASHFSKLEAAGMIERSGTQKNNAGRYRLTVRAASHVHKYFVLSELIKKGE